MIECHIVEPDASLITVGHKENKNQVCFISKDASLGASMNHCTYCVFYSGGLASMVAFPYKICLYDELPHISYSFFAIRRNLFLAILL